MLLPAAGGIANLPHVSSHTLKPGNISTGLRSRRQSSPAPARMGLGPGTAGAFLFCGMKISKRHCTIPELEYAE